MQRFGGGKASQSSSHSRSSTAARSASTSRSTRHHEPADRALRAHGRPDPARRTESRSGQHRRRHHPGCGRQLDAACRHRLHARQYDDGPGARAGRRPREGRARGRRPRGPAGTRRRLRRRTVRSTSPVRLQSDLERLRALAASSDGRIVLLSGPTAAAPYASLDLRYATAGSDRYPVERREQTRISISLPARYPFQPPMASVQTSVWHPNVFASGTICLGTKWSPTEGLDLFVQRLARLLTFDPLLVNTASAANREAAAWYERARRQHPQAFPDRSPGVRSHHGTTSRRTRPLAGNGA
ncbi:MAG: hypothetical protein MZV70_43195 [Desulfobacterales bacterium]|nr:hypothetical protein [Desulfobacterales bacterium]